MCTVSMIGDHYNDKWKPRDWYPQVYPTQYPPMPEISRQEFDALKKEVLEMKELLKRAVQYDKDNNQPHCEQEEKIALLKQVAKLVGVELKDVLGG